MNIVVSDYNNPIVDKWKTTLGALAVLCLYMVWIYWDTLVSIVSIWSRSDTFAHGYLVFPISAYLIWRRRGCLRDLAPKPSMLASFFMLPLAFVWFLADLVDVLVLSQFAFVCFIILLVVALTGWNVAKVILFPLLFLLFAVPFGEFLVPFLQDLTAFVTVKLLVFSGMPVYLEGRIFYIPSGTFEVAKACSGIRYLIASLVLGVLYAYLYYQSYKKRVLFVLLSILFPLLANGVRAYGIVMLAHYSDYKLAVGVDHLVYGWLFFGFIIGVLFWAGWAFRDPGEITISNKDDNHSIGENTKSVVMVSLSVFFLIGLGPVSAAWLENNSVSNTAKNIYPMKLDGWFDEEVRTLWSPVYAGDPIIISRKYVKEGAVITSFVSFYENIHGNSGELINSANKMYDQDKWRRISGGKRVVSVFGEKISVNQVVVNNGKDEYLIWQFYQIGRRMVSSSMLAKYHELTTRLFSKEGLMASVVLATLIQDDEELADARMEEYINKMAEMIYARAK